MFFMLRSLGSKGRKVVRSAATIAALLLTSSSNAQPAQGSPTPSAAPKADAAVATDDENGASDADVLMPLPELPKAGTASEGEVDERAVRQPSDEATAEESARQKRNKKKKRKAEPPPAPAPVQEAELRQWDDRQRTVRRSGTAMITGLNIFGWPYLGSFLVGYLALDSGSRDEEPLGWLMVPGVGPFLTMATMPDLGDAGRGVLIANGVLQSAGLVVFATAFGVAQRADRSFLGQGEKPHAPSFAIAPVVTPNGAAIGVSGSF